MALQPGDKLGPYELTAPIGKGGMGEVWKARDPRLNRDVAIKVSAAQFSERFEREAHAIAALNHPHICQIYDVGTNYLVMEYVEGKQLSGPLSVDEAVRLAVQIAGALEEAHGRGILHRDLKPANIVVTVKGSAKLLDFGLAKLTTASDSDATQTIEGTILGTAAYMAPEQAEGKPLDERSDVFSFGAVLYEMLSGNRAFGGNSTARVLSAVLRDDPSPLQVPAELHRIVSRCLAKQPGERFATMAELRAALEQVSAKPADQQRSIAVLPFVNMNHDDDGEFFADGVAEDIISALAKLPGLRVVARSAAFQFKGRPVTHEEVRDKLKVGVIVEGSVRRSGQRIRVTAELINAADGYQMWSERYDRVMEDVFEIQDEISRAIASKLEVKLSAGQKMVANRTQNIEAYNCYLRGRQQWFRRTLAGYRQAGEYFRRAVAEDSWFIPALGGLADCLSSGVFYGVHDPAIAVSEARKLLERALAMDPESAEAHTSLGFLELVLLNLRESEKHFLTAHRLRPDQALTLFWHACLMAAEGRVEEALAMSRRAVELEPTVPFYGAAESVLRLYNRETEVAIAGARKVLEMEPGFPLAQMILGQALGESGRWEEAIQQLSAVTPLMAPGGLWTRGYLGSYLGRKGDIAGARQVLTELLALRQNGFVQATAIAAVHLGLGEHDRAVEWLEQAAQEPGGLHFFMPVDPVWKPLAAHPRFQKILSRWKRKSNSEN
jgi:TolB-like protein/tRNA A-37 threonylcarbamoyl transferase component Bud32/Flp pilus assembly protein TadD